MQDRKPKDGDDQRGGGFRAPHQQVLPGAGHCRALLEGHMPGSVAASISVDNLMKHYNLRFGHAAHFRTIVDGEAKKHLLSLSRASEIISPVTAYRDPEG